MPTPIPLIDIDPAAAMCCAPLASAPLNVAEAVDLASRLKALADPARIRLLSILLASQNQQACTCELTGPLNLSQPTVTHHLRKLHEAGIVTAQRRGVWTYYRVVPEALVALAAALAPPVVPAAPG